MHRALAVLLLLTACTTTAPPRTTAPMPSPVMPTIEHLDGFVPLQWDAENGKLLMEITRFGEEMIWQVSLASGVGSNPIGLDRGQLGATHSSASSASARAS
jgi:hypothetical protein